MLKTQLLSGNEAIALATHQAGCRVASAYPGTPSTEIMETVEKLYPDVRPEAEYKRSLGIIENIKRLNPGIRSKSGIMVGLGESKEQVIKLFSDLLEVGCDFLTIGQYLAPSKQHIPIKEYIEPSQFDEYGSIAKQMGFKFVASAPLVRSSFHAEEALA